MKKKQTKKNKFLIRKIVAIIVIVVFIFFIRDWIYEWSEKRQTENTRLMLNNEIIETDSKIYVEDSTIYISEEDIKNIFDKTIYYNVGDKELITTFNTHVAVMHLNQKDIMINDSNAQIDGQLKEIDNKIYLPITDLKLVYDLEVEYSTASNMVILNSTTLAKEQVIVLKDTNLKKKRNPFSVTIETLKRGDYLYIVAEEGKYFKVRTSNGNIGYIKQSKVSDKEVIREIYHEDELSIKVIEDDLKLDSDYKNLKPEAGKTNVAFINNFYLQKDVSISNLIDVNSEVYKNCINSLKDKNIEVFSKFVNDANVSNVFSTYEKRNIIINKLYELMVQNQYKGICIDFSEIDDINSFYRFLIELTPKFKESGFIVVVQKNELMEAEKVKNIVDFVVD